MDAYHIAESGAQQDFEVLAPADGVNYSTGEMHFAAQAVNGIITAMTLSLDGKELGMKEVDGQWQQYVTIDKPSEVTATFAATFKGGTEPQTQTVNFTVAAYDDEQPPEEQPQPAGGTDKTALNKLLEKLRQSVQQIVTLNPLDPIASLQLLISGEIIDLQGAFTDLCNVATHLKAGPTIIAAQRQAFDATINDIQTAVLLSVFDSTRVNDDAAAILNAAQTIVAAVK